MSNVEHNSTKFKKLVKDVFETYCDTVLYTLKFYLLGYLAETVSQFGELEPLKSSGFVWYDGSVRTTFRIAP